MIHICYGLYDRDGRYSKFIGTSMASVFENTVEDVTVHILHDNTLTVKNRDKFIYLTAKYGRKLELYNVETLAADSLKKFKDSLPSGFGMSYSIAAIYRLLMPELIPQSIEKIIYLDADILVNLDIDELWQTDLSQQPIAVIPEILIDDGFHQSKLQKHLITSGLVREEDYFNSGVLLLDLKYLHDNENVLLDGFNFVCEHPKCKLFDQDILNYCFASRSVKLPAKFDHFVNTERIRRREVARAIYHYVANSIQLNFKDQFNRLYFEYFVKTPWFNLDMLDNVFKSIDELNKKHQTSVRKMINLIDTKTRIFFTKEENIPAIRAIFDVDDDELVINASDPNALMQLIKELKPRKSVCFILSGGYAGFRQFLLGQKYVEGVDFIDAMPLVTGGRVESHSIVRAM